MFRRSISAMMADILCIERMCYLAVPNCRAIFLSSPTIHKKLVTPRERGGSAPALAHTGQKVIFSTSETFYLFPWFSVCFIVVSDPILLSLQSRGMLRHVSYVWGFSEWLLLVESASLHIHTSRIYHDDAIVNVCLNKLSAGMDK